MEIKILNLKSETKRREYMKSQLSGASFSFFEALSPKDIDEKLFENKPELLSREAVATFESHRKIIGSCKDVPLLVLEDDSTPRDNNYLNHIDELLKIGYFPHHEDFSKKEICDTFVKLNRFIGMHGYIINPLSVNKILDQLGEPITHVDYRIAELIANDDIIGIFSKKIIFRQNNWYFKTQIPKARDILKNGENK